ncbi:hypothetical protein CDCA_CDCA09G2690 [Cyanidium caldarium]|uniref:Uncharacterized protein n=1 Tax=Cyanidium caldarium TaxID=2771 RepID=A0AAV9IX28_CYACA|nr:hypothetical protein CDCA_CDCA09G2690 [Cyanidium caldarium]
MGEHDADPGSLPDGLFDIFNVKQSKRPPKRVRSSSPSDADASDLEALLDDQVPPPATGVAEATVSPGQPANGAALPPRKPLFSASLLPTNFPRTVEFRVTRTPGKAADGDDAGTSDAVSARVTFQTSCLHAVSVPGDWPAYDPSTVADWPPTNRPPAKQYKFELDAFQVEACKCLEIGESVLVAAHTSAGKTAVAEYAVAMSLREHQRVIYTSPIKALSNQKYRELQEEFGEVGLMTGDVTINPGASCLVMTTEILRSMLYRGSEVVREVAWVIFDEVHYMRDRERGVVWEESIILLPDSVRFVFLSATIQNAEEFAEWVAMLHCRPCHTIYTDKRPVPLRHYALPPGADSIMLLVDERGALREPNFAKLPASAVDTGRGAGRWHDARNARLATDTLIRLVQMAMERNLDPLIVFSFSRRECEAHALQAMKLDLLDDEEKALVGKVFDSAVAVLGEEDRKLPQIRSALEMLKCGIGIHHSGLLPLLKEVVEILFQEGLVKVLFATETFAMGLNMPAKTVIFTALRKFDGERFRPITSGEYIQMSGRAGRRGIDDMGVVILMLDDRVPRGDLRRMLTGQSDALRSTFHLEYNMLLNLHRSEHADPVYMISRSFAQFQLSNMHKQLWHEVTALEAEAETVALEVEERAVREYAEQQEVWRRNTDALVSRALSTQALERLVHPGRLVQLGGRKRWAVVAAVGWNGEQPGRSLLTVHALDGDGALITQPHRLATLQALSTLVIELPPARDAPQMREAVAQALHSIEAQHGAEVPELPWAQDIMPGDEAVREWAAQRDAARSALRALEAQHGAALRRAANAWSQRQQLQRQARQKRRIWTARTGLILQEQLNRMTRVLRRLHYLDDEDVITTKGRTCCEVHTADELVLSELIFEGVFSEWDASVTAALLTCFVFDEKSKGEVALVRPLRDAYAALRKTAYRAACVMHDAQLNVRVPDYVEHFVPDMMPVVYHWCRGTSFARLMTQTTIYEGSVIRCMRRLEELLHQLRMAAASIGNTDLERHFEQCSTLLKRDIVFAASLYL